jgi:hypothetical protein
MARQYTTATSDCLREKFPGCSLSELSTKTNEYAGIAISEPEAVATGQRVNLKNDEFAEAPITGEHLARRYRFRF